MDPSHMVKLIRNRLASCGTFFDTSGNKIEWRYIKALYEYSQKQGLYTHKLTKKHMEWKRHVMNVRIAVETMSNSVADSIEYLMRQNIAEFQGTQKHY